MRLVVAAAFVIGVGATSPAMACGAEPFVGEICPFAGNYCPAGLYMEAAGQELPINRYAALFSVLGTAYGGDGKTSVKLPDLRGRSVVGANPKGANGLPETYPGTTAGESTGSDTSKAKGQSVAVTLCIAVYGTYPTRE